MKNYEIFYLLNRISLSCLDKKFYINLEADKIYGERLYIQIEYTSKCINTGVTETWKGRKWYLSEYMTADEIVKTCYAAFEAAVKHEILEGFKVDNKTLFNPHVDFEELLKISHKEVKR